MSGGGSAAGSSRNLPKDAQVMVSILNDMGISEYEPKVIDQMLDFSYKYVTNVLEEAKIYSNHSKKRNIDGDDVRLAIQMICDKSFTNPPNRELLMEVARSKNSQQLPMIKSTTGARLPPDRYTLTSANFRCKTKPKAPTQKIIGGAQMLQKTGSTVGLTKSGQTLSVVSKTAVQASQLAIVNRPTIKTGVTPRPMIKFATAAPAGTVVTKPKSISVPMPQLNIVSGERKRKTEDEQ